MVVTALDTVITMICKDLGVRVYDVDGRTIFPLYSKKNRKTSRYIMYLYAPTNGLFFKYGIIFRGLPDVKYAEKKIRRCNNVFQKNIRTATAKTFDPDGGDLGLGG